MRIMDIVDKKKKKTNGVTGDVDITDCVHL